MMNRRKFLLTGATGLAVLPALRLRAAPAIQTAKVLPAAAFDREVEAFLTARKIPGGALAVVKDRRLVYVKCYGWADREKKIPARPDTLFRIASVSKPVTAVAVLKLVEEKKLDLDARAFDLVRLPPVLDDAKPPDPRLARITIRQLLQHTGGWDRDQSFDPMFRPVLIAGKTGTTAPAGAEAVIRYMLGQPLDFDPGTRYAYSNFGYCVLGRVIERVTRRPYEAFVRETILTPMGIRRMRLGATLDGQQAQGEARYYMTDNSPAKNVFPGPPEQVPWPYGGFHLEAMDAHGGWLASAVDLVRFAAALDGQARRPFLKPATLKLMHAPPPPPASRKPDGTLNDTYYVCGWSARPVGDDGRANYWHSGSLPGTATLLVRRHDGLIWAMLFNQRSEHKQLPDSAMDAALHRAANAVTDWPKEDLFAR